MTSHSPEHATIMVTEETNLDLLHHFSHFMMEYFIDVALWCHDNPGRHVIVFDCGPCTPWFGLLESVAHITVLSTSAVGELADEFPDNVCVSRGRHEFASKKIGAKLRRLRSLLVSDTNPHPGTTRVMARRTTDPTFYAANSWMRHIKNETELVRVLETRFSFRSVEFFETSPREAIDVMSRCSLFVAQRGAALMNLIFMPPGSTVVEIYPRDFEVQGPRIEMYRRTCAALGFRYVRVYQRSKFSAVSPLRLTMVLAWILLTRPFARPPAGARE